MDSRQLKSQALGLALGAMTAIGCLAYEKIVKNFSLGTIVFLTGCFYIPLFVALLYFDWKTVTGDIVRLAQHEQLRWHGLVYVLTFVTTPLWYIITRNQSVMAGAIYEVKYILMLAIFYIFWGSTPMTLNTVVGICCAIISVYFISK
jgi:drug/metabolite transporter (DMT)-like permease